MADYILEPLDTDNEVIFQDFVAYVQQFFPEWHPSEGQLDIIIARYFAMQAASTADMASRVQRAIYRYFGSNLAGIGPLPGSPARATVTFVVDDPADPPVDRSLPFGSLVGLTDRNGDIQVFSLLDDLDITAGDLAGDVLTQAIELGSAANGITGSVELIEMVEWISSASVVGSSSGGSDPEDDGVYVQRLTENLALMAPRPILADDFTVFAQNIPGVWRAAVLDNFNPGVHEKQRIAHNYTGGNFKLTFQTQQTANIPWNASYAQVRDALALLLNLEVTDLNVTGGPLPTTPIDVEFIGRFGYQNLSGMTFDISGLTGGSTFTITETDGAVYTLDRENAIGISAVDEQGNPLTQDVKDELVAYLESTRSQNFLVTFVDPAYHVVRVNYAARALKNQNAASVKSLIDSSLELYLSPAKWGVYPYESASRNWILQPVVRYLELTTIVENVPGVDYVESLTFSLNASAFNGSDKSFNTPFSLTKTTPGGIIGNVELPS
jgi:hypothetical protein